MQRIAASAGKRAILPTPAEAPARQPFLLTPWTHRCMKLFCGTIVDREPIARFLLSAPRSVNPVLFSYIIWHEHHWIRSNNAGPSIEFALEAHLNGFA
jgi:hypothetical protein